MLVLLLALQATTTNCAWTATGWTCSQPLDYNVILNSGRNMVPPYQAKPTEDLGKRVGRLIAQGKCADAQKMALREGAIELAKAARDYCEK